MDHYFGVSYKLSTSENFEEFMKALGVGLVHRKIANNSSPVIKLTKADGVYTLHTSTTFKNEEVSFKPGVEFEETTPDGRKVKTTIHIEGNRMIQTQISEHNTSVITREFSEEEMKATFTIGDVVCKRVYARVH